MYKLFRNILFWFDAEQVHYFSMNILKLLCNIPLARNIIKDLYTPKNIPVTAFGLQFKNPVGLGAGFDKNAKYLTELEALGFGFVEIGTVTPLAQQGNDKPRLFRLPEDKALINRMGFNNDGADVISNRLKKWRGKRSQGLMGNDKSNTLNSSLNTKNFQLTTHNSQLIIGGNIGKNKKTPNEDAWKDYETSFLKLYAQVDYFVVNVSSPNTPGLRELQQKDSLKKILTHLQTLRSLQEKHKPILLKISPDLVKEEVDDIIELALEINLDGLIIANTTIKRENLQTSINILQTIGAGGLSGKPLRDASKELLKYIYNKTKNKIPIIASGGIFAGEDAVEKINAGANLVQVWTGFIYEGPLIVKNICRLIKGLKKNNIT